MCLDSPPLAAVIVIQHVWCCIVIEAVSRLTRGKTHDSQHIKVHVDSQHIKAHLDLDDTNTHIAKTRYHPRHECLSSTSMSLVSLSRSMSPIYVSPQTSVIYVSPQHLCLSSTSVINVNISHECLSSTSMSVIYVSPQQVS